MSSDLKDIIKEEYKRCSIDALHFIKKYTTIQSIKQGKIKFSLYPFQEKSILELVKHRYTIFAKGRQLGLSTLVAAYALWRMIFTEDYKVLIVATTQDVAKELLSKVQLMYEKLPVWIRETAPPENFNKLELKLKNGSVINAVASSEKAVRSKSLSLLIFDEFAFIDDAEDLWVAAQATLATGGDCVILSSANGVDNKFHEIWTSAIEGNRVGDDDPFNPILLPWNVHPDRDQKWADGERSKLGERKFAQEHSVDFLTSGHTVVDGSILQWYKENQVTEPLEKRYGGSLWMWEYPNYSKDYIITADVSRGDGADYSAFHVFEVETMRQCASFKAKIGTREYGAILVAVGTEWNNALLVIDNHNMGWDVVQVAVDAGYKNLYYTYKNDPFYDENIHLRKSYDLMDKRNMTPGFTSSTLVRANLISKLDAYLTLKEVVIRDIRTINELFVFMWINGKAQAQKGRNDDLVMALSMALYIRDTAIRMKKAGVSMTKNMLSHMHRSVYTPNQASGTAWQMQTSAGNEDIRWLLGRK
jgi:hypothetical protein